MEIALRSDLPTYSGGLGVLAGDTLRSCADLGLSVTGVTLLHRKGYFRQTLDADGRQRAQPVEWDPDAELDKLTPRVRVEVRGEPVLVRAYRYRIRGARGHEVPVYLLDTDLPENSPEMRAITDHLYGGDDSYRLCQELVLGVGGVRILRKLGYQAIDRFHLNEGHAALAIGALVEEKLEDGTAPDAAAALQDIRPSCVFTTHTPVPAGHDKFPRKLALEILGEKVVEHLGALGVDEELNMTLLALEGARFVNGVAMRHGEVSRGMFPGYPIRSITNGVHPATWASQPFRLLYDRHVPHWRTDPASLRGITAVDLFEIQAAHRGAKLALLKTVEKLHGRRLDPDVLTIGFGRRATAYKRPTLILHDMKRLERIADRVGPIQLVFSGKAHPKDLEGQKLIRQINKASRRRSKKVSVVFLPGFDMEVCGRLVAGCDVWLNNPIAPLEASGTSGMKAAFNGVPSLSILDGWWVEGCVEGVTGWAIGRDGKEHEETPEERDLEDAFKLYEKLEEVVAPCFYHDPERFHEIMRYSISINASFFNTHRMIFQYLYEGYRTPAACDLGGPNGEARW